MKALDVLRIKLAVTSLAIFALKQRCSKPITSFSLRRFVDGKVGSLPLGQFNSAIKRRVINNISPAHPEWGSYVGLKRQAGLLLTSIHVAKYEEHENVETLHHGVRSHCAHGLQKSLQDARDLVTRLQRQLDKGKTFDHLTKWYEKNCQYSKAPQEELAAV